VAVDVSTEIEIDRARGDVASFASDPDNAIAWYQNIKAVEWRTPRPAVVGSRTAFVARFLGRTLTYTYEVTDVAPEERFVMSTADGPFSMETTYTWNETLSGGTRMTLRNRGTPSGFLGLAAPLVAKAMRRANDKDLRRLKALLERPSQAPPSDPLAVYGDGFFEACLQGGHGVAGEVDELGIAEHVAAHRLGALVVGVELVEGSLESLLRTANRAPVAEVGKRVRGEVVG
jgi:polyketide cyclase/dehydrase/lipid transport protein